MDSTCYRIDTKSVIFERFEGEVIAIHLDRGTYYSLNAAAADIFELISAQSDLPTVIAALNARYASAPGQIESDVTAFVTRLRDEGLIQPATGTAGPAALAPAPPAGRPAFEAPTLSVHRDMQELFLLDPVHDVAEAGWPEPRPADQ